MTQTKQGWFSMLAVLVACCTAIPAAQAALVVTLDVPQLATAGSANGFEFVSFQFDTYLTAMGDCASDYCANVLANDRENYTYLAPRGCGTPYCQPDYVRTDGNTYSATYQAVTSRPSEIDAFFHFSGDDVAGQPLLFSVQGGGNYTLTLTQDGTNTPIDLGTPLSSGRYTLEYRTDDLQGAEIVVTAVPLPPVGALGMTPGLFVIKALRRRRRAAQES